MAFQEFSIRRPLRQAPVEVLRALPEDAANRFRLRVESEQRGPGQWHHAMFHDSAAAGDPRSGRYFAALDFPCAVGAPEVLDPFVMALAFHQMTLGGTLEVEGPVSRRLIHNLAEVQSLSHNRWPRRYRPFALEPRAIVEAPYARPRRRGGVIALSGGLDSTLALYRQTDPALAAQSHPIACGVTVLGFNPPAHRVPDTWEGRHLALMQRLCARRGLALATIRTDLGAIPGYGIMPHGAVLGGLMALAAAEFPFGVLASSAAYGDPWHLRPIQPSWQRCYGTGGFEVPTDLGPFTRAERVVLLAGYGEEACDDLAVCGEPPVMPGNCCACGKCVRTMLAFEAAGLPMPRCFPRPIDPRLIGYGGSGQPEIGYYTEILQLAAARGIATPNLRLARRRYLRKALKRKVVDFVTNLRWT